MSAIGAVMVALVLAGVGGVDAQPGTGTGTGTGTGSGTGSGPRVIPMPTGVNAPEVSAAAAPTVVRLGNRFTLFVTARYADGVEVNLREPLDLGPAFEVTRKLSEDRRGSDGRRWREWQIEVIAWELGDLTIAPIAVTYTAFGKADQVATNAVRLRVEGVLGDEVDDPKALRGDAAPRDLLVRDWFWLYVAIGGGVGLAAAIAVIAALRRRRRRGRAVWVDAGGGGRRKLDTPASRALARLQQIADSGVLDGDGDDGHDARKRGYAEMVETIREYLGARYRVATYDLTTRELVAALAAAQGAASEAAAAERAAVERWLESCDIVKYGGLRATAAIARATLDAARALVRSTSPAAPTADATPEAA